MPAARIGREISDATCGPRVEDTRDKEILTIQTNRIQCSDFSLVEVSTLNTPLPPFVLQPVCFYDEIFLFSLDQQRLAALLQVKPHL